MEIKAEITFPGELKDQPLICSLCKDFDVIINIIEASFSTEVGWAILVFKGREEEIKQAFEFLKEKGVKIENIEVL
ncbi:MAG: NIL domain-containing protein [Candidatus Omnitrophica bacterium]|nr:NIL domain-containing protein [Candidatus Omnitrophota bacterium]